MHKFSSNSSRNAAWHRVNLFPHSRKWIPCNPVQWACLLSSSKENAKAHSWVWASAQFQSQPTDFAPLWALFFTGRKHWVNCGYSHHSCMTQKSTEQHDVNLFQIPWWHFSDLELPLPFLPTSKASPLNSVACHAQQGYLLWPNHGQKKSEFFQKPALQLLSQPLFLGAISVPRWCCHTFGRKSHLKK